MSNYLPIPGDMTPKGQEELWRVVNQRLQQLSDAIGVGAAAAPVASVSAPGYSGSHLERLALPAASVPEGSTFYEQDRTVWYKATTTTGQKRIWKYFGGEMVNSSSTLAGKPTDLGADDAGFRLRSSVYARVWLWSGSAWGRAPGELRTLQLGDAGAATTEPGWHDLDGSTGVRYTKADATTATVDLPNGAGTVLIQGTWDGAANAETAGSVSLTLGVPSSNTVVQSGTGASAASTTHTHAVTASSTTGALPPNVLVYRAVRL